VYETAVTVIGLGPMGQALAGAFLEAGHRTTVWNRTAAKIDPFVARGAIRAETARSAFAASPLAVVCLRDDAAVHATLASTPPTGAALVNLTSSSPAQARGRAEWAAAQGIGYVDGAILTPTPSIGTPTAFVLYSGAEQVYDAYRDTLASLGGTATYLGADPGRAAGYDTALLDIFWSAVSGIVHGIALAGAEGISGRDIAPYAQGIFGLLPEMMGRFARQSDARDYPGERSTVDSALAGIEHIIATAESHRIDVGALTASKAVIARAVAAGHGKDGLARLVETLRS